MTLRHHLGTAETLLKSREEADLQALSAAESAIRSAIENAESTSSEARSAANAATDARARAITRGAEMTTTSNQSVIAAGKAVDELRSKRANLEEQLAEVCKELADAELHLSDVTRRRADGAASIAAEVDCLEADAASGNAAAAAAEQSKAALSAGVEMIHGGRVLCKASMKAAGDSLTQDVRKAAEQKRSLCCCTYNTIAVK